MIKLIKYHVTKRPGRLPGAHIQCQSLAMNFDSLSNSSLEEKACAPLKQLLTRKKVEDMPFLPKKN